MVQYDRYNRYERDEDDDRYITEYKYPSRLLTLFILFILVVLAVAASFWIRTTMPLV